MGWHVDSLEIYVVSSAWSTGKQVDFIIYLYIYIIPSVTLHDTSYSLCYLQPVSSCPNFCVEQVRNVCFVTIPEIAK